MRREGPAITEPPHIITFVDNQGRYLATFLGPIIDYVKVWEWARHERGALVPLDLMAILEKDRRFRRLAKNRVIRIG